MTATETALLICLPHGGSIAAIYRRWADALPAGVSLLTPDYPGRGRRADEEPARDLAALAADLADRCLPEVTGPVFLYGHSFGATVAFETGRRLQDAGADLRGLVVAACRPPLRSAESRSLVPSDLDRMGRLTSFLLQDEDYRRRTAASLAHDEALLDSHAPVPGSKLDADILAIGSTDDATVTTADLERWAEHGTRGVTVEVIAGGGHLFHLHERQAVQQVINSWLTERLRSRDEATAWT